MKITQFFRALLFPIRFVNVSSGNTARTFLLLSNVLIVGSLESKIHKENSLAELSQSKSRHAKESFDRMLTGGFIENKGQMRDMNGAAVPFVLFRAESNHNQLYITETGLTYVIFKVEEEENDKKYEAIGPESLEGEMERIDLCLRGANIKRENIKTENAFPGHSNYFQASSSSGIYRVKKYQKVTITEVYPGIDWVFYNSDDQGFKHDFIVHPGADPSQIKMVYISGKPVIIDDKGQLQIQGRLGSIIEHAPLSYLKEDGRIIESTYRIASTIKNGKAYETDVRFELKGSAVRSATQTLVIDPQLTWATFLGGSGLDGLQVIEVDPSGNIFVAGYETSANFPVFNAGTYFQGTLSGPSSIIVKFSGNGVMLWSTYYSYASFESLTCNASGDIYVCGLVSFPSFVVQNAGGYFQSTLSGVSDAFLLRFDNLGNLLWSTFFGGSGQESGYSVTTDKSGNVFMIGTTTSTNLPLQNAGGYFQSTLLHPQATGFITKFSSTNALLWSTYFNGTKRCFGTTDGNGALFVTGEPVNPMPTYVNPGGGAYFQNTWSGAVCAFLSKFDAGTNLVWCTYYGGNVSTWTRSICVDKNNNVIIGGTTNSSNLPFINSGNYYQAAPASSTALDVFLAKFSNSGVPIWGTCFGGTRSDDFNSYDNLATDTCGNIYLAFETTSRNVPLMSPCEGGYLDNTWDSTKVSIGDFGDLILTRFTPDGKLTWSTYYGGSSWETRSAVGVDKTGNIFVTGEVSVQGHTIAPATYTLVNPGSGAYFDNVHNGSDDGHVLRFSPMPAPVFTFSYGLACNGGGTATPSLSSSFPTGGTFSASPALSVNPSTGQLTLSATPVGVYTVTYLPAYSANTCSCFDPSAAPVSTTVQVISGGTLNLAGTSTICTGVSVTYTASGATSYSWSTGAATSTVLLKPTVTATYVVTGNMSNGCKLSKTFQITVNKCTGVEEQALSIPGLHVYPNPNNGDFTVESDSEMELQLYDVSGKFIRTFLLIKENAYKINVSNLAAGVYFIYDKKLQKETGQKLIVEK